MVNTVSPFPHAHEHKIAHCDCVQRFRVADARYNMGCSLMFRVIARAGGLRARGQEPDDGAGRRGWTM